VATLICSQGHPNPVGQRFCGDCGEDLAPPAADPAPAPAPPAGDAGPRPSSGNRYVLVALGAVIVVAAVALVVLLVSRASDDPASPPATTVVRGDAVWTWYFPATTSEAEVTQRVDTACSTHPEVGSIQVTMVDTDVGNFDNAQSHTFTCP
jgi:hypothetical protein